MNTNMENKNKNEILRQFPSVQSLLERIKDDLIYKSFPYEFIKDKIEKLILVSLFILI